MKLSVLYHSNCWDGFCAAWLLWLVHGNDDVEYLPVNYGQNPPSIGGDKVMIVDFSYKRDVMEALKAEHPDLIVLDHHKSAKDELEGLEYCTFDMEKSGARLTLDWIIDNLMDVDTKALWLVAYTEDRDLWLHELPDSKAINAALRSYPLDFKGWVGLAAVGARKLMPEGEAILRAESNMVESAVKNAKACTFHGNKTWILNATQLISEIGMVLSNDEGMSLSYFIKEDSTVVFSMRSQGHVDVAVIAKEHGGGGHPNAAGFQDNFALLELILAGGY